MTNREFFSACCVRSDLCAVNRYAMMDLADRFENMPMWEKEEVFEKWMNQPFDPAKWDLANHSSHRIPHVPYYND